MSIKYNKLKRERADNGDFIKLVRVIYSSETGEPEGEAESMFDASIIPERISALQKEIEDLTALGVRIENNQFDADVDRRKPAGDKDATRK